MGELRRALQGIPDGMPIKVNVAEEPAGDLVYEQVLIGAGFGRHRMHGDPPDIWRVDAVFGLDCEFPSGTYYQGRR